MFCPKCGRINPDENETCKGCGAPLHTEDESVKKPKSGLLKKIIISLALTILVVIAVFVLLHILG